MNKELIAFLIKIKIKDEDGQIKQLLKKINLEIVWQRNSGILEPTETITRTDQDGKVRSYRKSKGEVVSFEKDGKKYNIGVEINNMRKGWFKDTVNDYGFYLPTNSSFTIYDEKKDSGYRESNWYEVGGKNLDGNTVNSTQRRWTGFVLIGIILTFFLIIGVVWWKENKKKKIVRN